MANFAVIGVGGYIAPRHLEAIKDLGHNLVTAYDINDSVGIMDRFFPDCMFFTEFERFEAFVDSLKGTPQAIDYVSICSPNYLHASHIKFALRHNANAICEKPLVLNTKDLDDLLDIEKKTGKKVFTVLQLRVHDAIIALKNKVEKEGKTDNQVTLDYMTSRGQWYLESWKGDVKKSGGLSTNIGVHFFDMLTWIFGKATEVKVEHKDALREKGYIRLEKAQVKWELTIDSKRLPESAKNSGKTTFRQIKINDEEFEFSEGFTELHKRVYTDILNGKGYGLEAARYAIEIVEDIRGL